MLYMSETVTQELTIFFYFIEFSVPQKYLLFGLLSLKDLSYYNQ